MTSRERAGLNRVPIQVVDVPAGYVASQETALISFLNGSGAQPSFVPPRPSERGVRRHPTLVLNVETLANVALIARYGRPGSGPPARPTSPGSVLVTVSGAVAAPGVYEAALGTPVGALLDRAGGPAEPAAGGAGGRVLRRLAAAARGRRGAAGAAGRCGRPARPSAPASWSCSRPRPARWPRRRG